MDTIANNTSIIQPQECTLINQLSLFNTLQINCDTWKYLEFIAEKTTEGLL